MTWSVGGLIRAGSANSENDTGFMRFSLIVPTLDRPDDLKLFLTGMTHQTCQNFEVIVVDQSGRNLYEDVIAEFSERFPLRHIRIDVRKCRYACVVGAQAASGEIIAFPDDDCIYLPDTLSRVEEKFRTTPALGFLTGGVLNFDGVRTKMGRWLKKSAWLNSTNIWFGLIEFNLFIRREWYEKAGGFDPEMGPGTYFVAAEGQDLGLRLLAAGAQGYFDRELLVRHPDKPDTVRLSRALGYARGMGYVLRKNNTPYRMVGVFFMRPLGGVVLSLLKGQRETAAYYWRMLTGRLQGYFAPQAESARKQQKITH